MRETQETAESGERASTAGGPRGPRRPFLAMWFRCCHTYGRLYRNTASTAYEGRCPACGAATQVAIGPGGTNRRLFSAQ